MTDRNLTPEEAARMLAELEKMEAEFGDMASRLFYPRGRTAYLREFEAQFGLTPVDEDDR